MTAPARAMTQKPIHARTSELGPVKQPPSAKEALFHQHLNQLGEIFNAHRSWKDQEVSVPLRNWLVETLKAYVKNKPPSGEALQRDIRKRLNVLSAFLQDCLYQAPVTDGWIDRRWVWNGRDLATFRRLAQVFGVGEFYIENGNDVVLLSPIDKKPMQVQQHLFMNAMIQWIASIPMHLIDPHAQSPLGENDEMKREGEPEQALTQAPPEVIGALDVMQYFTILRVADLAKERVFQNQRAEETTTEKELFQKAMAQLLKEGAELAAKAKADQIAFELSIKIELATYQQANEAEKTVLKGQMKDLKAQNTANSQMISSQTATIHSLTNEVVGLRQLSQQRQVEIQHVYHEQNNNDRFCSVM
jgi:hypothetical protein